jgi:hypothetical protein
MGRWDISSVHVHAKAHYSEYGGETKMSSE